MRKADSEMQQQIEALIREEADPRERARLLILYQIASVLIDNVAAQRETTEEFRQHRVEYEAHIARENAYINQAKGMWRIATAVIVIAQAVLGYAFYEHVGTMRDIQALSLANSKELEVIRERHRVEERLGRQP